jgi:hypothetical protein
MNFGNYKKEPLFWNALGMGILSLSILPLLYIDQRIVVGSLVWIKPLKFTLSLFIYSITTLWILMHFIKNEKFKFRIQWILILTSSIEIILILFQAVRGETSHFNISSPLNGAIFSIMGISISIFWMVHLWTLFIILREKMIPIGIKEILSFGLGISAFGMILGFMMTSPKPEQLKEMTSGILNTSGSHSFGGPDGGPGISFFGWSTEYGDMRLAHFFGMHTMQIFTFFAAIFANQASKIPRNQIRMFGFFIFGITAVMAFQAMNGISFFRYDIFYSNLFFLMFSVAILLFFTILKHKKGEI